MIYIQEENVPKLNNLGLTLFLKTQNEWVS